MLLKNEFNYAIRQPSLTLTTTIASLICIVLAVGAIEGNPSKSDLFQIFSLIQMLILPFIVAILVTNIFLRDINSNMNELIDSSPLETGVRYHVRLITQVLIASLPFFLSFTIANLVFYQGNESTQLFMEAFVFSLLPNLILTSALLIFIATYTSSNFSTYAFSALWGIGYIVLGSLLGFPFLSGSSVVSEFFYQVMLWLDPLGITALLHHSKNNESILSTVLILNRVLSLATSALLVWATIKIRRTQISLTKKPNKSPKEIKAKAASRVLFSPKSKLFTMVSVMLSNILRARVNQVILLIWLGLSFNEVISGLHAYQQNGGYQLNSIDAINFIAYDQLLAFGSICIAMWSWLICWGEKKIGFSEIIAAIPTTNSQRLTAQVLTLFTLVFVIVLIAAIASITAQLALNTNISLTQYLVQFTVASVPLLIISACFVFIHHLMSSPAKVGAVLATIIIVKFTPITSSIGATNLLWNFAGSPLQEASQYYSAMHDFWGYGGSISSFFPFSFFWLMVAATLFSFAVQRSHRGTGLLNRNKSNYTLLSYGLVAISSLSAIYINQQLVAEKPLTYKDQQDAWHVYYEKHFNKWRSIPQPSLTHVNSIVDLFPAKGVAKVNLEYVLENDTDSPITEILIGRYGNYVDWRISPNKRYEVITNDYAQQHVLKLESKMLPGEQLKVNIDLRYQQPKLWPVNSNVVVKEQFTNIIGAKFLPSIGYQSKFETKDKLVRKKHEFGDIEPTPNTMSKITFSSVIGTKEGHVIVSQGVLTDQWIENDREYFKYESNKPIDYKFVWASLPLDSYTDKYVASNLDLYLPASFKTPSNIVDVLTNIVSDLQTYLGVEFIQKLTILTGPNVKNNSYVAPEVIIFDFDNVIRHLTDKNVHLNLLYKQVISPVIEQMLFTVHEFLDPLILELIKAHSLLEVTESHMGLEARKEILAITSKQYSLNMLKESNSQEPYFTEKNSTRTLLEAILLIERLEQIVGKDRLKSSLLHYVSNDSLYARKQFIASLKSELEQTKQNTIDELFAGLVPLKN